MIYMNAVRVRNVKSTHAYHSCNRPRQAKRKCTHEYVPPSTSNSVTRPSKAPAANEPPAGLCVRTQTHIHTYIHTYIHIHKWNVGRQGQKADSTEKATRHDHMDRQSKLTITARITNFPWVSNDMLFVPVSTDHKFTDPCRRMRSTNKKGNKKYTDCVPDATKRPSALNDTDQHSRGPQSISRIKLPLSVFQNRIRPSCELDAQTISRYSKELTHEGMHACGVRVNCNGNYAKCMTCI